MGLKDRIEGYEWLRPRFGYLSLHIDSLNCKNF